MTADAITLSIPLDKPFYGVARLVVGGLAARLDLTYEHLEDLQLALASVLETDEYLADGRVTVCLVVGSNSVGMVIGPVDPRLREELEADEEPHEGLPLRRLLGTLVDEIDFEGDIGSEWLRLEKRVPFKHPERRQ
jgi:hypothetical protein